MAIDFSDLAHVIYGVITVLSNLVGSILPLIFALVYLLYQWLDTDTVDERLGDIKEYGIGLSIGVLLMLLLIILWGT